MYNGAKGVREARAGDLGTFEPRAEPTRERPGAGYPDKLPPMSALTPVAGAARHLVVPNELPFLESLSWFDCRWRELSAIEMLQRYERGWRHRGVMAELSAEEVTFVRALIHCFGSVIDVPA